MTDREIVKLLQERDEGAVGELSNKYGKQLRGIALGVLRNEADAEECLNDAYLKVWNAIPPAEPEDLGAYVSAIVRNTAINMYHSARRQKDIPVDRTVSLEDADNAAGAAVDSVKAQAALSELTEAMARYIRTLPERDQKIFVTRYRFEAPVSLISRRLGIPAGTVMSSLHRLRKGLKSFLKEEGIEV